MRVLWVVVARASENISRLQCKRGSSKWASPHHKQFATFLRNLYIFKQLLGNFEIWASVRRTRRTLFSDALVVAFYWRKWMKMAALKLSLPFPVFEMDRFSRPLEFRDSKVWRLEDCCKPLCLQSRFCCHVVLSIVTGITPGAGAQTQSDTDLFRSVETFNLGKPLEASISRSRTSLNSRDFGATWKQPVIPGNLRLKLRACRGAGEEDRVMWLELRPGWLAHIFF